MRYKEDWELSRKRYEAWWEGEIIDRAVVQIYGPKNRDKKREVPKPGSIQECWTNIDYVMENTCNEFEHTLFAGDAFPCFWPNLGPDFMAGVLGADLKFAEDTSWSQPFVNDWREHSFTFDENNIWWKTMEKLTQAAAENAMGNYIAGITDLHPSLDCLSALRGPENLCMDMIDDPDIIKEKLAEITAVFKEIYNRLYNIIDKYQPEGSTTTVPVWHTGRYFINCCDFIYMISPDMFDEFALPVIKDELDFLDATVFHVDGIGSLRHIDRILELPNLKAIQWVYGDGQPSARHWIPEMKKMQEAGKKIYTYGPPEDLEVLLSELSPNGLIYLTGCKNEDDAGDLLKLAEKLSFKKKVY